MRDFIASIYEVFIGLYGSDAAQHLYGFDGSTFTNNSLYLDVFFPTTLVCLIIVASYYIIGNSPRWNKWYHWLIIGVITFGIGYITGNYFLGIDVSEGLVAEDLTITNSDVIGFGIASGIVSFIEFILFSGIILLIARKTSLNIAHNTKYTPF